MKYQAKVAHQKEKTSAVATAAWLYEKGGNPKKTLEPINSI